MSCVDRRLKPARASAKTTVSAEFKGNANRSVVVIEGPPGSGKSVIAAQLWASIASDELIDGNVILTTTSTAQRTNWEQIFHRSVGKCAARGVVIGSNQYNPGLNQPWLKAERAAGRPTTVADWRENVARFCEHHPRLRCADNQLLSQSLTRRMRSSIRRSRTVRACRRPVGCFTQARKHGTSFARLAFPSFSWIQSRATAIMRRRRSRAFKSLRASSAPTSPE